MPAKPGPQPVASQGWRGLRDDFSRLAADSHLCAPDPCQQDCHTARAHARPRVGAARWASDSRICPTVPVPAHLGPVNSGRMPVEASPAGPAPAPELQPQGLRGPQGHGQLTYGDPPRGGGDGPSPQTFLSFLLFRKTVPPLTPQPPPAQLRGVSPGGGGTGARSQL